MRHYGLFLYLVKCISFIIASYVIDSGLILLITAYTFALILLFAFYILRFCCIVRAVPIRDKPNQFDKFVLASYDVVGEPVRFDEALEFTLRFGLGSIRCLNFDVIRSTRPVQGQIGSTASDAYHVVSGAGDPVLGVIVVRT